MLMPTAWDSNRINQPSMSFEIFWIQKNSWKKLSNQSWKCCTTISPTSSLPDKFPSQDTLSKRSFSEKLAESFFESKIPVIPPLNENFAKEFSSNIRRHTCSTRGRETVHIHIDRFKKSAYKGENFPRRKIINHPRSSGMMKSHRAMLLWVRRSISVHTCVAGLMQSILEASL